MARCLLVLLLPLLVCAQEVEVGGVVLHPGPQDRVEVSANEWSWRSGAVVKPAVNVTLRSGRFTYVLRHDRAHDNGRIGLAEPTSANWYQAGMIDLLVNGERIDLLPEHGETLDLESGRRGTATFAWHAPQAKLTYTFALVAGEDRLYLIADLEPKVEVNDLEVRLTNYVAGFNRDEPRHAVHTPTRVIDQPGRHELKLPGECALFYEDRSLDVADTPASAGPSALVLDPAPALAGSVTLGGYGVQTALRFRPDSRRLAFCLWEYPDRANAEALALFEAARDAALAALTEGGDR